MQITTSQLKEYYSAIIDRLDALYSLSLTHTLTFSELSELDEIRSRALLIQTELSQRERQSTALFA